MTYPRKAAVDRKGANATIDYSELIGKIERASEELISSKRERALDQLVHLGREALSASGAALVNINLTGQPDTWAASGRSQLDAEILLALAQACRQDALHASIEDVDKHKGIAGLRDHLLKRS